MEVGNFVRLTSGGPVMVVAKVLKDTDGWQQCECLWFDVKQHLSGYVFDMRLLMIVEAWSVSH